MTNYANPHCMKKTPLLLCLAFGLALLPQSAQAQRVDQSVGTASPSMGEGIAAIVNDNVISTFDLNSRIHLAMLSSGLADSDEVRQRLTPQILRGLIDEQLQLQEAKRLDISVTSDEIDKAMSRIAEDNHIPGGMREYLASQGAAPEALEQQIRATMSWTKVVQRELRPRVEVGDDEIDSVIARIRTNAGKEEFLVGEIFLAVDSPKDEDQVHSFADNLVQQIKAGGNFPALAHQFSQSAGAATGGDIGWVQEGQLPPEINRGIESLHEGEVTDPIRSASGYHILVLRQKRTISIGNPEDMSVDLQQAFRPADIGESTAQMEQEGEQVRSNIIGCTDLKSRLETQFPNWRVQSLGNVKADKIPSWMASKISGIPEGSASAPIMTGKGALLIYVCTRKMGEEGINRDAIMSSIGTEKLELQARRLLRDLRRSAYLDVRVAVQ